MTDLAIETQGLSKKFGPLAAVDRLDLRIPTGSVFGFFGRNGAGKTTTIKMLLGPSLQAGATDSAWGLT